MPLCGDDQQDPARAAEAAQDRIREQKRPQAIGWHRSEIWPLPAPKPLRPYKHETNEQTAGTYNGGEACMGSAKTRICGLV